MAVWFVGRHAGASEWIKEQGFLIDHHIAHLNIEDIQAGDKVVGTLPIHLVAKLCEKKAEYWHLSIDLSPEQRGKELDTETLKQVNARLEQYYVKRV